MIMLLALLFSVTVHADFIWDTLPKSLPTHENFMFASNKGLSVFWWNTQMGELNQEIYRTRKFYPLDSNLKELTESQYLPDVLILGEYNEKNFAPKTVWDLKKIYPHFEVVINNSVSQKNIAVYSRYPFKISHETLTWFSSEKQKLEFQKIYTQHKFFDREFIHVEVIKNNQAYHLIPAHLLNQWADLLNHYRKKYGKDLGKIKFAEEMIEGQSNPMMYQIRNLKSKMAKKKLTILNHTILGDMNCPSLLYNVSATACHLALKRDLMDTMPNDQASFPAASSTSVVSMPPLKIDHAIHSKGLKMKFPQVLPLLGSDHYPLMFVIQNSKK